jgi:ankyrin repeat protein
MDRRITSLSDSTLWHRPHHAAQQLSSAEPLSDREGTHEIQRRVSDCSLHYAEQVSGLLRRFSISNFPGLDISSAEPNIEDSSAPITEPKTAVEPGDMMVSFPGGFLNVDKTQRDPKSWLEPDGRLSARAQQVLDGPSSANLSSTDAFGNTALHLVASLEGHQDLLLSILPRADDVSATNASGQTFLHVLDASWFVGCAEAKSPLRQLLTSIDGSEIVYAQDMYGRTFCHHATHLVDSERDMTTILSMFDVTRIDRRDAFGVNPVDSLGTAGKKAVRTGAARPFLADESTQAGQSGSSLLSYHAHLVQIIQSSYNNPWIEDDEGRNGLHCLAEAILDQRTLEEQQQHSADDSGSSSKPRRKLQKRLPEDHLAARLRHLEGLLSIPGIDPNHYSTAGQTPLMAFIEHIADDQEDRSRTLRSILETLVMRGARLEARNRAGETPLLLAARLARKVALQVLLERGADAQVRDARGRDVLEVIDEEIRNCALVRQDADEDERLRLYGRLMACRAILTGKEG